MVYTTTDKKSKGGFFGRKASAESGKIPMIRVTSTDTGAMAVRTHKTFRMN